MSPGAFRLDARYVLGGESKAEIYHHTAAANISCAVLKHQNNVGSLDENCDSHFFHKRSIRIGENVSFLPSQIAAGNVKVDPQVGVVAFYGHTDVLIRERTVTKNARQSEKILKIKGKKVDC